MKARLGAHWRDLGLRRLAGNPSQARLGKLHPKVASPELGVFSLQSDASESGGSRKSLDGAGIQFPLSVLALEANVSAAILFPQGLVHDCFIAVDIVVPSQARRPSRGVCCRSKAQSQACFGSTITSLPGPVVQAVLIKIRDEQGPIDGACMACGASMGDEIK